MWRGRVAAASSSALPAGAAPPPPLPPPSSPFTPPTLPPLPLSGLVWPVSCTCHPSPGLALQAGCPLMCFNCRPPARLIPSASLWAWNPLSHTWLLSVGFVWEGGGEKKRSQRSFERKRKGARAQSGAETNIKCSFVLFLFGSVLFYFSARRLSIFIHHSEVTLGFPFRCLTSWLLATDKLWLVLHWSLHNEILQLLVASYLAAVGWFRTAGRSVTHRPFSNPTHPSCQAPIWSVFFLSVRSEIPSLRKKQKHNITAEGSERKEAAASEISMAATLAAVLVRKYHVIEISWKPVDIQAWIRFSLRCFFYFVVIVSVHASSFCVPLISCKGLMWNSPCVLTIPTIH